MRTAYIWARGLVLLVILLLVGPAGTVALGEVNLERRWWQGSRDSAGLIAPAAEEAEAIVRVFGARAVSWRGAFAIHTWIAVKPAGASAYTRFEVIGWRYFHGLSPVKDSEDATPDRYWFGNRPGLLAELKGAAAAIAIPKIQAAVAAYPYIDLYRTWPGPNSNTFTAWIGRNVPELAVDLPPTAIGKDYRPRGLLGRPPSGRGLQLSLFGLIGAIVSPREGLEINVLGLSFGLDVAEPALRLPGFGRIPLLPS